MRAKLPSVVLLASLAACASEYKRVPIPPSEQEHKAVPQPPRLQHVEWKVLRYQGKDFYALDGRNMSILNDNLMKMAQHNAVETEDFRQYETAHPEKTSKVIRKKNFWVFWNKWWFGCNDKEFQNTPSCRPFMPPPDYVEPLKSQAGKTPEASLSPNDQASSPS